MTSIRMGTFETNSSSCHSLVIINMMDYKDLENKNKLITDLTLEVSEHESITNIISHDQVLSKETIIEKYYPTIKGKKEFSSEDDSAIYDIISNNWNEDLLDYLYFDKEPTDKLKADLDKHSASYFDAYEMREFLSEKLNIRLESWETCFHLSGDASIDNIDKIWTPCSDCVYVISSDISC